MRPIRAPLVHAAAARRSGRDCFAGSIASTRRTRPDAGELSATTAQPATTGYAVFVSVPLRRARVVEARVMLAQQISAVVVAVRRPDHRVDVVARGRVVVEGDPALVVELDQDDRA